MTAQAAADSRYFIATCGRHFDATAAAAVQQTMLAAYRLQYILSGARHPHFAAALASMTTDAQLGRIHAALSSLAPMPMHWPRPEPHLTTYRKEPYHVRNSQNGPFTSSSSNIVNGINVTDLSRPDPGRQASPRRA